jgi:hypothetical protein
VKHFTQDLMVVQGSALYQRTDRGRAEIKNKSYGLTQSERLVLLMTDGVSSYEALCRKMTGMTSLRLERAILQLAQQGLVAEVLLPQANPPLEVFDNDVIDLFLRQDALDPVTVISFEPEQEYGAEEIPPAPPAQPPVPVDLASWTAHPAGVQSRDLTTPEPRDFYWPADAGDRRAEPVPDPATPPAQRIGQFAPPRRVQAGWEHWFIGLGLLFLLWSAARHLFQ